VQRLGRGGGTAASASFPLVRVAGLVLLTAHLAVVAWLAVRPVSVPWVEPPNLRPFATIRADLASGTPMARDGLLRGLLLLAPLGVLLPVAGGRLHRRLPCTWARTVGGSALLSSGLVVLRSAVPGHIVNVDAVLLNTAGVAVSCALFYPPVRAWLRRRSTQRPSGGRAFSGSGPEEAAPFGSTGAAAGARRRDGVAQGPPPTTPRVGIAP